jgi:uncharacterized protein
MKVVLDTNVLLSAFLTDGICARILKRARNKECTFIFCASVLKETQRLLKDKFTFTHREIAFFISILSEAADDVYQTQGSLSGICRDPNDDSLLLCAGETEAVYLVTGDKDLLVLKKYKNTKIISPRDFESLFDD